MAYQMSVLLRVLENHPVMIEKENVMIHRPDVQILCWMSQGEHIDPAQVAFSLFSLSRLFCRAHGQSRMCIQHHLIL